ncbi:hypothetical protein ACFCYB_00030 [Streptomyces sp. NPDC056309]|uniref:hypothetical protein n=1 Tax=Streptomyces sp. NPDC056309 TaxID=3345781 RepID=UPI0035DF6E29
MKALNDFVTGPPVFVGYASTAQAIYYQNTGVALSLDTTIIDTDNGHSNTTNNSRYTATVPGTYLIFGSVGYIANTSGDRRLYIALNGTSVVGSGTSFDPSQSVLHGLQTAAVVTMNGTTDYVEVMTAHSATVGLPGPNNNTLSTNASGIYCPSMQVLWVSR